MNHLNWTKKKPEMILLKLSIGHQKKGFLKKEKAILNLKNNNR
jgi:hypothetical protein